MIEKSVILPVSTPVQVKLSVNEKGLISIGIRINGSKDCILAQDVAPPKAGTSKTFPGTIGDIL